MEAFKSQPRAETVEKINNREKNIMAAQEYLVPIFDTELAKAPGLIAENPYYRPIEYRS